MEHELQESRSPPGPGRAASAPRAGRLRGPRSSGIEPPSGTCILNPMEPQSKAMAEPGLIGAWRLRAADRRPRRAGVVPPPSGRRHRAWPASTRHRARVAGGSRPCRRRSRPGGLGQACRGRPGVVGRARSEPGRGGLAHVDADRGAPGAPRREGTMAGHQPVGAPDGDRDDRHAGFGGHSHGTGLAFAHREAAAYACLGQDGDATRPPSPGRPRRRRRVSRSVPDHNARLH